MFQNPVLVVGDVMLDRHVHGQVRRISPEAPVPVVSLLGEDQTPGGAGQRGRVAGRAWAAAVTLAGLIGDDAEGEQLRQVLALQGVERLALVEPPGLTTISKTRILSDTHQQLLRLDRDGDRDGFAAASSELARPGPAADRRPDRRGAGRLRQGRDHPRVARAVIGRCRRAGHPLRRRPQEGRLLASTPGRPS